ncbi:MAG TPA: DNA recombination protein RmuC [Opitutus sp.]|nr:DNA recombination protein RmuC [Opitutus sp.]
MPASLAFIAVIAAALVGGLIAWLAARARQAALTERARAAAAEADRLSTLNSQLATQAAALSTTLAAERAAAAEKLAALTDAHNRLTAEFKALSADALARNNTAFLDLARESFAKLHQQSAGDLEKRQQAIDALVKPLRESLQQVDAKIGAIENARKEAYGSLSEQLRSLNTAQLQLQTEAARLSTALRSTTYAGSWGELQLRRVVEMADMLAYCDFAEQQTAGSLRADLVVRLPGGQRIVVDAKTPLESFRAASESTDEAIRAARLTEHAQKVRGHIDALGAKNYWEQFQPAPEFVVLFLPGDQFLGAALHTDSTLMDRAIAKRVLLATPSTLIALLKAAAYGWRQESLSQNAEEISQLGRQLYERMVIFAEHLDKVGRSLDTALKGFNSAVGSFESSVLPGARRFAELGARGARELAAPGAIETTPRDIARRA